MDRPDEAGLGKGTTASASNGGASVDARAGAQAAVGARATPVAGRASPGNGAAQPGRGIGAGGEGRSFLGRTLGSSAGRRLARRLLATGDAGRQRIEQDLHDGVQQHLTGLRIRLTLAAAGFRERGETEAGAVLEGFGRDVDDVIGEVRDLAQGIYPNLLTCHGLSAALASAGLHAGRPVTVHTSGVRRCWPEVEIAVYFSCLAALDNAAKHAGPGPVSVWLRDSGRALQFTVCDSGVGFDPSRARIGMGIANIRDRIAAVGGTVMVDSAPARGTRVRGTVPNPGWT
jgi:signal transduction histidine kinase